MTSNKKQHAKFMFDILNILEENDIPYSLACGTLLGIVREGDFLDNDNRDTDIVVPEEYEWKIRNIFDNRDEYIYGCIWRKEISILPKDKRFKMDIFLLEKKGENDYRLNSYKINDKTNTRDIEWQIKFPNYFPTQKIKYRNGTVYGKVNIPKNFDEILTIEYGNWRVPEPNFQPEEEAKGVVEDYKQIAIIVPTMYRSDKILSCINSAYKYLDGRDFRFYIGDQSGKTNNLLRHIQNENIRYYELPKNAGISYTRNELIKKSNEPYIFITDDDTIFTQKFRFDKLKSILLANKHIGIAGAQFSDRRCSVDYAIQKGICYYLKRNKTKLNYKDSCANVSYSYYDAVANCFLAKREVFDDIQWKEELKFAEHTPFFLDLKDTKWKVTYTDEVAVEHNEQSNTDTYAKYLREIKKYYYTKFYDLYDLKGTKNIDFNENIKYGVMCWDKIDKYSTITGTDKERLHHYVDYFPLSNNFVINIGPYEERTYKGYTVYDVPDSDKFAQVLVKENANFLFTWNCENHRFNMGYEACQKANIPIIVMPVSTANLNFDLLKKCDYIIPISQAIYDKCLDNGIDSNKMTVIPIGVSGKKFYPKKINTDDKFTILTIARGKSECKNWYNMSQAVKLFSEKIPTKWVVVGSRTDKIKNFNTGQVFDIYDLENSNLKIDHKGVLPQKELNDLYNEANVFLLTPHYEGQGLCYFEAFLTGTPVVTSDIEPMRSYINKYENIPSNGLLANPNDINDIFSQINKIYRYGYIISDCYSKGRQYLAQRVVRKRNRLFVNLLANKTITSVNSRPLKGYNNIKDTSPIDEFFYILNHNGIKPCLLQDSCKAVINHKELSPNIYVDFHLSSALKKELKYNGFDIKNNHIITKDNCVINIIKNEINRFKDWDYKNYVLQVPLPVIGYLDNIYGENKWKE